MFNGAAAKQGGLGVTDSGNSGQRTTEQPSAITPVRIADLSASHPREGFRVHVISDQEEGHQNG